MPVDPDMRGRVGLEHRHELHQFGLGRGLDVGLVEVEEQVGRQVDLDFLGRHLRVQVLQRALELDRLAGDRDTARLRTSLSRNRRRFERREARHNQVDTPDTVRWRLERQRHERLPARPGLRQEPAPAFILVGTRLGNELTIGILEQRIGALALWIDRVHVGLTDRCTGRFPVPSVLDLQPNSELAVSPGGGQHARADVRRIGRRRNTGFGRAFHDAQVVEWL